MIFTKFYKWFNGTPTCIDCSKSFPNQQEMKNHIQNLEAALKIYCKNCEQFIRIDETESHLKLTYSCSICKIILDDDILPITHHCFHEDATQETATKNRVQCAVCDQRFFSTADVGSHIKEKHFSVFVFLCKCCKTKFESEQELTEHFTEKHVQTSPVIKPENGKRLFHKKVKRRTQTKNSDDKFQKKCTQCPLFFDNKKDLMAHKRKAHEVFLCYICGRKMHINFLRTHLDMHEDNKRFKCKFCDKRFRLPGTLRNHQMIHSSESNYQCQVCGKSFKKAYNLKVHMRIHSPVKPFECVICKKTFTTKQSRDNHLKTHK